MECGKKILRINFQFTRIRIRTQLFFKKIESGFRATILENLVKSTCKSSFFKAIFFPKSNVALIWDPDLYAGLDPDQATEMNADQCGCGSERIRIPRILNLTEKKGNQLTEEIKNDLR